MQDGTDLFIRVRDWQAGEWRGLSVRGALQDLLGNPQVRSVFLVDSTGTMIRMPSIQVPAQAIENVPLYIYVGYWQGGEWRFYTGPSVKLALQDLLKNPQVSNVYLVDSTGTMVRIPDVGQVSP